ncbi:MAG: hypothetical protein J5545_11550 [Bacteroidaceae bacterium]|nr:hypothetical protein [Bacteroidaceae bacterium]
MFFNNEQTTAQMSQLYEEARQWWSLQKQYVSLNSAEILARLFSAIALWAILILVGSMVLLFASFALAYWLGELLDSTMLGFVIIAAVLFLAVAMVWAKRRAWIIFPTTRFMVKLFVSQLAVPTQEGITMEKQHLREQLDENQEEMRDSARGLLSPSSQPKNGWETASNLFQNGYTIFRGVQIGVSAVAAARALFKLGRKRK